ncbi:MAG: acyl-CoA reductase [Saprospiraceae bacterium]|nr:acyl-CoA reductase [Saprospiraceae bacterium]
MQLQERIELMSKLGDLLSKGDDELDVTISKAALHNPWFTQASVRHAIDAVCKNFLEKEALKAWSDNYNISDKYKKNVGLILAGNIPMVGFHDLLSVFISGHVAKVKLSSKDEVMMQFIISQLKRLDARSNSYFEVVDRLNDIDAMIATGSNSTGNYFSKYFGHLPNIIRRNRHAVAVVPNSISKEALSNLGKDIFTYFGLGCRNVSKLYLEDGFEIQRFFDAIVSYGDVIYHNKYKNNYDYSNALYLLNQIEFLTNNFLIVRESRDITSRIASVHYEYFTDLNQLESDLVANKDAIQCVVSQRAIGNLNCVNYGEAQSPSLTQYADGVDIMQFLTELHD